MLNVAGNRIAELPDSIGSARRLTELDCSHNRLTSLPNSLGDNTTTTSSSQLTVLDVSDNRLAALPVGVGNLSRLRDLRAGGNSLHALPDTFTLSLIHI